MMGWELFNSRALRQGHWKLVWIENPYGNDNWELYNLLNDPLEENNLAETNNIKLEEMVQLWNQYVKENSVIIDPDLKLEYSGSNFHYTY